MYDIVLNVINNRLYELSSMLRKIETLWVQGELTDDQKAELVLLARDNADYQQTIDVMKSLDNMTLEIRSLQERLTALENGSSTEPTPPTTETYEEYVSGKWYYSPDRVLFNGKVYECTADKSKNEVCVWSPADYPSYWKEITTEVTE